MLVGNTLALKCEEHNFLCVQAVDAWSAELRMSKNAVVCAIVREATLLAEGCVAHLRVVALIVLGGCHHNNNGKATRHGPFLFLQVSLATLNGVVFFANPEVLRAVQLDKYLKPVRERQMEVEVGRTWSTVLGCDCGAFLSVTGTLI